VIKDRNLIHKLFHHIGPAVEGEGGGGYVRVVRTARRHGRRARRRKRRRGKPRRSRARPRRLPAARPSPSKDLQIRPYTGRKRPVFFTPLMAFDYQMETAVGAEHFRR
jgi:hypothetical protein